MTVAVMFRYIWYGTFRKESERLNRLLSSLLIVIQTQIAYIYVTRAYNAQVIHNCSSPLLPHSPMPESSDQWVVFLTFYIQFFIFVYFLLVIFCKFTFLSFHLFVFCETSPPLKNSKNNCFDLGYSTQHLLYVHCTKYCTLYSNYHTQTKPRAQSSYSSYSNCYIPEQQLHMHIHCITETVDNDIHLFKFPLTFSYIQCTTVQCNRDAALRPFDFYCCYHSQELLCPVQIHSQQYRNQHGRGQQAVAQEQGQPGQVVRLVRWVRLVRLSGWSGGLDWSGLLG